MIVNSLKDGWEIIYQRSHANLAAMLLAGWQREERHPRFTELIIATAQHDDQEMFWNESVHLTDIGAPLHFTEGEMGTTLTQAQWVIDNAYRQGVWIALMISMHNSYLYGSKRGSMPQLDAFLDQQKESQSAWRRLLKCSVKEAEKAYAYLQWADSLSLILCLGKLPEFGRQVDVAPLPDGTMCRAFQREDRTVGLDPWVFDSDELTVSLEVRRLHTLKFDNEEHFRRELNEARLENREWLFRK